MIKIQNPKQFNTFRPLNFGFVSNFEFRISNFNQKGFTLVEMIVVIFIMALLSTVSIANFRQGEKQKRVALAADIVVNGMRSAQNYTLAGKKTNNSNGNCRTPVHFYTAFYYSSPTIFNLSADNNCGTTDTIETYTLPINTRIKSPGLALNSGACATALIVVFVPPFSTMNANCTGAYSSFTTATITVESTDGTVSKAVTVDGLSGRIGE